MTTFQSQFSRDAPVTWCLSANHARNHCHHCCGLIEGAAGLPSPLAGRVGEVISSSFLSVLVFYVFYMLNIQQGLTLADFFVETTFPVGHLLQPLLSPLRHLLLPQVQLDLHRQQNDHPLGQDRGKSATFVSLPKQQWLPCQLLKWKVKSRLRRDLGFGSSRFESGHTTAAWVLDGEGLGWRGQPTSC